MKGIKKRLQKGEAVIGTFVSLGNPITTEIIGTAPWDWLMLDLEHGLGSEANILSQLQALSTSNISSIIRVEGYQRQRIHRVLDMGADGIMCPHIETAAESLLVTRAMRYAPEGLRGVAKMVRATNFGVDFDEYHAKQEENLLAVIQIETAKAVDNIEEIAGNPDIDVLFIGPADLSMSLGVFGQLEHPKFLEAEAKIIMAAKKAGKTVGFLIMNPEDYPKYYDKGIRFFACGTDAFFLKKANAEVANRLVELREGKN
jgi:2-keto-3-deoxy-L-rhamnonate aldolase RhmA